MQDFSIYFFLGWYHIISWEALDHLLFIAALTVIYRLQDWRKVLLLVTSFTIGHLITLVLSVLDIIRFSSQWVEFLIPLTIISTAAINFSYRDVTQKAVYASYFTALCFGLIHGMGFASVIRFSLIGEQSLGWSLLVFNLGLECGQIVVVLIILCIDEFIRRLTGLNRRIWVSVVLAAILIIALKMAFDRIPKL